MGPSQREGGAAGTMPSGRVDSNANVASTSEPRNPRSIKYAVPKSSIGYQLLQKSGWREGQGLGTSQEGVSEPVTAWHQKGKKGIGAAGNTGEKQKRSAGEEGGKQKAQDSQPAKKTKAEQLMTRRQREAEVKAKKLKDSAFERHMRREFSAPDRTVEHNPLLHGSSKLSASNPLIDD